MKNKPQDGFAELMAGVGLPVGRVTRKQPAKQPEPTQDEIDELWTALEGDNMGEGPRR